MSTPKNLPTIGVLQQIMVETIISNFMTGTAATMPKIHLYSRSAVHTNLRLKTVIGLTQGLESHQQRQRSIQPICCLHQYTARKKKKKKHQRSIKPIYFPCQFTVKTRHQQNPSTGTAPTTSEIQRPTANLLLTPIYGTRTHTHTHTRTHARARAHTHTHTHARTHARTHTHTHTHTPKQKSSSSAKPKD